MAIRDPRSDIVGFVGRDLSGDRAAPKYLNKASTAAFTKGETDREIQADLALIGVGSVSAQGGYWTSNLMEAAMLQGMMQRSARVAVLADSTKLQRRLFAQIAASTSRTTSSPKPHHQTPCCRLSQRPTSRSSPPTTDPARSISPGSRSTSRTSKPVVAATTPDLQSGQSSLSVRHAVRVHPHGSLERTSQVTAESQPRLCSHGRIYLSPNPIRHADNPDYDKSPVQRPKPTNLSSSNPTSAPTLQEIHRSRRLLVQMLRAEGYQVSEVPAVFSPHQIDPAFGGTPQVRERVFITATLVPDGHVPDPLVEPVALLPQVRMQREWDLAEDLPLDETHEVPDTQLSTTERMWIAHWEQWVQQMLRIRAADADAAGEPARRLPGFPIWAHVWVRTARERRALEYPSGVHVAPWKASFLHKNWDLYDRLLQDDQDLEDDERWLTSWLRTTRGFPESRQKLEWQAQDERSLWNCVISLRPSGLRAKRMTHLPALVGITQTPILGPRGRRLSPREAARLQGLPDEFDFGGQRDAATFKQLGNGVHVGVVWNVLKAHVERDKHLLLATEKGCAIYEAVFSAPAFHLEGLCRAVQREELVSADGTSPTTSLPPTAGQ